MRNLTSVGRKAVTPAQQPHESTSRISLRWRDLIDRGLPVAVFFAIAFLIDQATGQRYSAIWGSAAIVASLVSVFPGIRPSVLALGSYGLIWGAFNLGRAVADDAGIALAGRSAVSSFEARLFGGTLPSKWLQDRLYDPDRFQPHDIALALVHLSFFVTPFVVGLVLWLWQREAFGRYCRATAITFGLGLIGFLLLPTAPPWMSDPDTVTRITTGMFSSGGASTSSWRDGDDLSFEPNHLAALPSVHVAIAVLVFLALRSFSPRWSWVGGAYAAAMTLAVVYLGEHFVLDALLGWAIALLGWRLTRAANARPGGGWR
jgi:FtsH-binding integral membrane protein